MPRCSSSRRCRCGSRITAGSRRCSTAWRAAGVTDLRAHLRADPRARQGMLRAASACSRSTARRWRCSRPTTSRISSPISTGLPRRHARPPMSRNWCSSGRARPSFSSNTVNYTLSGRRLDIQLHGRILPGHEESWERVLVAIEDVTERETRAGAARAQRELRARPVRAFAGVAVGRGFLRRSRSCSTRSARAASPISASSPTCIRNSSPAA